MGAKASFERELVDLFAQHIQANARIYELPARSARAALLAHKAHIATGLDLSGSAGLQVSPVYRTARLQVLCGASTPKNIEHLTELPLAVVAGSAEEAALRTAQTTHPDLKWESRTGILQPTLLDEVMRGNLACTLASEHLISKLRNLHPGLEPSFEIGKPVEFVWAFPSGENVQLLKQVEAFFAAMQKDGTLNNLQDRYFRSQENYLTADEAANFIAMIDTTLPRYQTLFQEAGKSGGIGWQLVAAIAFHESRWDPQATSPTNVRGMMMLTEDTASRMKVRDRLDPRQSTFGGVHYLNLIKARLPESIMEPDRTWFTLAAYNQGMAHLEDARKLAQRRGMNPNYWVNVKRVLPLLSDPEIYSTLKFGPARGGEAVFMVEKIRQYSEILAELTPEDNEAATLASTSILPQFYSPLNQLGLP